MINDEEAVSTIELLVRRMNFVEQLQDRPLEKPEIVDALGASRSTIDRAVRELQTHGLIEYSDGGYTTTIVGDFAARKLVDLGKTVQEGHRLTPFLQWLDTDEFELNLSTLGEADLYLPKPADPYAMVNRHVTVLENTMEHQLVLPLVGLHAFEAVHDIVLEKGGVSESVVTPHVAETFQSNPDYGQLFEELAATERFRVYVYEGEIPYFVGILDNIVQIGVDKDGEPRALLKTENPEVKEWAENRFQSYKMDADRLN